MEQLPMFIPADAKNAYNNTSEFDFLEKFFGNSGGNSRESIGCGNSSEDAAAAAASSFENSPHRIYRIVLDVYVVSIICLLGFLGNTLTIVILWSDKEKKSTTNWLLQSLAVIDIVYLVGCIFIQPLKTASVVTDWLNDGVRRALIYAGPYIWTLASMAQMVTVWTVMLVTVDRYIAVCYPLKGKLRTLNRAKWAMAFVVVVAVVYNIPMLLEREVDYSYDTSCEREMLSVPMKTKFTSLRNSDWYFLFYKTICYFIFRSIGPLFILVTLNIKLVRALQQMRRRHRHMTSNCNQRQKENVTLTLVVVVTVFIVCELPDVCLRIAATLQSLVPDVIELDDKVIPYLVNPVTNMLLTVNSSANFLIYCLIGKKFRSILVDLCLGGCCCRQQQRGDFVSSSNRGATHIAMVSDVNKNRPAVQIITPANDAVVSVALKVSQATETCSAV